MRRSSGQVALSLNLVIAIFVVGSLGLVSYEMSRILLAREQLKHCLELAALGGGAELASTSQTGAAAQTTASAAAINILQMNSILGQPLTNSVIVSTSVAGLAPGPGQVSAYVEFDDPLTGQPGALGQANVLRVYGAYAYPLFSGGFGSIGVNVYTVMADATAGLPALDLVVVYNHDDSMDDQTPVSFVRRYWDPTLPAIAYLTPPPAGSENGILAPIICAPPIGTPVNGLPPQNLDAAGNPQNTTCGKQWSETGPTGTTSPLRGTLNMGAAPGDQPAALGGGGVGTVGLVAGRGYTQVEYAFQPPAVGPKRPGLWLQDLEARIENFHLFEQPAFAWFTAGPDYGSSAYNPWNADSTMFTDLVVNLDGNPTFGGYVDNGNQIGPNGQPMPGAGTFAAFAIPTMDFLVESSRGNMESNGNAPTIHEDNGIAAACQPGYKQAYQCCAYRQLQPKISVEEALQGFLTKISTTCDCHLGFVAFNDRAGMSPADSATAPAVSYAYPVAGNATYALPQIPLQLTGGGGGNPNQNPNLMAILNVLTPPTTNTQPLFVPNGGSNLAAGLQQAMANLTGPNSRQGAMKAIVVVTDKVPSRDLAGNIYSNPAANAPALADAMTFATAARAQGIPIFMVTVAQNPTEAGQMTQQFSDVTAGGLVNTAGSGGTLYVENWTTPAGTYGALTGDFNNVIRQLMTLVQGAVQGP